MEELPREEKKRMRDLARFAKKNKDYLEIYSRVTRLLPMVFRELGGRDYQGTARETIVRKFKPDTYLLENALGRRASDFLISLLKRKDIDLALKNIQNW